MDDVQMASALTEEFLGSVLCLAEADRLVIHTIIGWAFLNQACADCASHQEKLAELLAVTLTGCESEIPVIPGGLISDASLN